MTCSRKNFIPNNEKKLGVRSWPASRAYQTPQEDRISQLVGIA